MEGYNINPLILYEDNLAIHFFVVSKNKNYGFLIIFSRILFTCS